MRRVTHSPLKNNKRCPRFTFTDDGSQLKKSPHNSYKIHGLARGHNAEMPGTRRAFWAATIKPAVGHWSVDTWSLAAWSLQVPGASRPRTRERRRFRARDKRVTRRGPGVSRVTRRQPHRDSSSAGSKDVISGGG